MKSMDAIDEVERVRREGLLTFGRGTAKSSHPDDIVVEEVWVTLSTPSDPHGKCVENICVEWTSTLTMGQLIPRICLEGGSIKMLALFPELLIPVMAMQGGHLTPDAFIDGLRKVGVEPGPSVSRYVPVTTTCSRCECLYRKADCSTPDSLVAGGHICNWCVQKAQFEADTPIPAGSISTEFAR